MPDEDDRPLTEEEQALAREGESLIAAAMADVRAPQSLREAIERERQRAASRDRPRFWRRHRWGLAAAGTAAAALAVVAIALETGGSDHGTVAQRGLRGCGSRSNRGRAALGRGAPPVLAAQGRQPCVPGLARSRSAGRRSAAAWTSLRGATSRRSSIATPRAFGSATRSWPATVLGDDPPGREITRKGKTYNLARNGDRTIVTWTQQGHTCVIVAPSALPGGRLVDLAASRNV